jgi:hypothetical protein
LARDAHHVSGRRGQEKRVKRFDYYAPQQSWKMPKWLGAAIGVVFAGIAIGSGLLILQLTKKAPIAAVGAVAAAPQTGVGGVATTLPAQPLSAPVAVSPPVSAEPTAVPEVADSKHHSSRHHGKHDSKKSSKMAKATPAAKAAPAAASSAERGQILAKHDSKEKRHEKDALDKLLGL